MDKIKIKDITETKAKSVVIESETRIDVHKCKDHLKLEST